VIVVLAHLLQAGPAIDCMVNEFWEETMKSGPSLALAMVAALAMAGSAPAHETLRLAVGQRGLWDTSISDVGQRAGIFKKHGLNLEILYTQGSGETQQAAISGSVEVAVSVGIMGGLSAYSKGAPVRIIGSEMTGAADIFWYVNAASPIKALRDADGKTIAYSTNGSSTHGVVTAFIKQFVPHARAVATGGPAATLTAVMSGQVDVGWAAPPFGLDQLDRNEIRQIASGNDTLFKGQTVRLLVTAEPILASRKDAIDRYLAGYRETVDWMYSDPDALKVYADFAGITEAKAERIRDQFFPKSSVLPDEITGLDLIIPDAVELKFITAPLSRDQLAELIQIPPRK
jgi:NitT/TauT family transport system substrate-binding protein